MILTRHDPDPRGYVKITDVHGNDHAPFLSDICSRADEDGPRLVYCDQLEEWGWWERAEFCRVQIELASVYPDGDKFTSNNPQAAESGWDRYVELRDRERELFQQSPEVHGWFGPVLGVVPMSAEWMPLLDWWRRGFIESVTCTAADWLQHGGEILSEHPVQDVTLTSWPNIETRDDPSQHRLRVGGKYWFFNFPGDLDATGVTRRVLAQLWPRVKTWRLPPPQRNLVSQLPTLHVNRGTYGTPQWEVGPVALAGEYIAMFEALRGRVIQSLAVPADLLHESQRQRVNRPVDLLPGGADARWAITP